MCRLFMVKSTIPRRRNVLRVIETSLIVTGLSLGLPALFLEVKVQFYHPREFVKGILCLQSSGAEVIEAAAPGEDRWPSSDNCPLASRGSSFSATPSYVSR